MGQLSKDFEQVLVAEGAASIPAYTAGSGLVFLVPCSDSSAWQLYTPDTFYPYGPYSYSSGTYPGDAAIRDVLPDGAVLQLVYGAATSAQLWIGGQQVTINFNPALPNGVITIYGYVIPSYPIDARDFTEQEFQAWARPLVGHSWQALPYWATAVEFPDEDAAPNGYPLVEHNGPITGVFKIPTETGEREVSCEFFRDAPSGNWRPRAVPTIEGLYFSNYMGAILFRGDFSRARVPAVPPKYRQDPMIGWNAGALSLDSLPGDVHVVFNSGINVGGAVGFTDTDTVTALQEAGQAPQREDLRFAWYFDTDSSGVPRARVMENGLIVETFGAYDPGTAGTTFEIRRVRGQVTYWTQDGADPAVRIYTSPKPSSGDLVVGTALYAGGDTIP